MDRAGEDEVDSVASRAIGSEGLTVVVEDETPGIDEAFVENFGLLGFGSEVPSATAHEATHAVRGLEVAVNVNRLAEVEHAIRAVLESVDNMVGVLGAKAGENRAAFVGNEVAVGVLKKEDLGGIGNIGPAVPWDDTGGDMKVVCEDGALVGNAIAVGIFEDENFVIFFCAGNNVGIHSAGDQPKTTLGIPVHLDRLGDHGIGGEEIDLHAFRQIETCNLFGNIRVRNVGEAVLGRGDEAGEREAESEARDHDFSLRVAVFRPSISDSRASMMGMNFSSSLALLPCSCLRKRRR